MKTIIISDIHNRVSTADNILRFCEIKYPGCEFVLLGDYFDSFTDDPDVAAQTALWLKNNLAKPNRTFLLGNHDMPYMVPENDSQNCPGFSPEKCRVINRILTKRMWELFRPACVVENWLLSHAGFHPTLCGCPVVALTKDEHVFSPVELVRQAENALVKIKEGKQHRLFFPGARMIEDLHAPPGGITWLDWFMEFQPFPHINQIVGHTILTEPEKHEGYQSVNWCLDTCSHHIGIIEDGKFTPKSVQELLTGG